jgi:hypothetical protein
MLQNSLVFGIIFLRVFAAPFIFRFPIVTSIVSAVLDLVDGLFFARAGKSHKVYVKADKFLDLFWMIFIFFYLLKFRPSPQIMYLLMLLFAYRFIGHLLLLGGGDRKFLFYFPNVFEHVFWVYLYFSVYRAVQPGLGVMLLATLVITAIKLPLEYALRLKKVPLAHKIFGKSRLVWYK